MIARAYRGVIDNTSVIATAMFVVPFAAVLIVAALGSLGILPQ